MGKRIITLMTAYNIKNRAAFAEGVLGITRQRFHAWLYEPISPENISAKPILICAEALGTNAEYLLCMSDDARPEMSLTYEESTLIQAFRELSDTDQERLLKNAADWVAGSTSAPTTSTPFRTPVRRES